MEQTPSVGRIVHYVSHGTPIREDGTQAYASKCRAAIVTEVTPHPLDGDLPPLIGLCVLNPTGEFFNRGLRYDEGTDRDADLDEAAARLCDGRTYGGGTWHWPERV